MRMPTRKQCAVCGVQISVAKYRLREKNYCSVICANKGKPRKPTRADVCDKQISELYIGKDMSSCEIALAVGMSRSSVCRRIKKMGITKSPYGHEGRNGKKGKVMLKGYPVI